MNISATVVCKNQTPKAHNYGLYLFIYLSMLLLILHLHTNAVYVERIFQCGLIEMCVHS